VVVSASKIISNRNTVGVGLFCPSSFSKKNVCMVKYCFSLVVIISLFQAHLLNAQFKSPIDSCEENTYIKSLGESGVHERGFSIINSNDGNIYLTGSRPDSAIIIKMEPNGKILWSRAFDFIQGTDNYDNIVDLEEDSDGMLIGCGVAGQGIKGISQGGFYFKYNPDKDEMIWQHSFSQTVKLLNNIKEKAPGENYILVFTSSFFNSGAVVKEIDRTTGEELSGIGGRYDRIGATTLIYSNEIQDSTLYGIGKVEFSADALGAVLYSININSSQLNWSKSYFQSSSSSAFPYTGLDLIVDGNQIISIYSGNDTSAIDIPEFVFLQKTTLDGEIVWIRKFDLTDIRKERALELVRVNDGYVIFGRAEPFASPADTLWLLKTDIDGNLLWANKFDYSGQDHTPGNIPSCNQLIELNNYLYFIGHTNDSGGATDLLIGKLDFEGNVGDSCNFITQTPVETTTIIAPTAKSDVLTYSNFLWEQVQPLLPLAVSAPLGNAQFESICEDICPDDLGDPCDVKTNGCVVFEMLDVTQDNNGDLRYRVRFTNNCTGQELRYLAIELPKGTVAVGPVNGSTYITPNGRSFSVRNPNFSPFYSIRFKGGLGPGESDVFDYTLKGFSRPKYFNVLSRLWPGPSYEAHLNVFNCPIQSNTQTAQSRASGSEWIEEVMLVPNPVADVLTVSAPNLSDNGQWEIFSIDGKSMRVGALSGGTSISIPVLEFQEGVYLIRMPMNDGTIVMKRFVKAR
jgi:hypothetical protein